MFLSFLEDFDLSFFFLGDDLVSECERQLACRPLPPLPLNGLALGDEAEADAEKAAEAAEAAGGACSCSFFGDTHKSVPPGTHTKQKTPTHSRMHKRTHSHARTLTISSRRCRRWILLGLACCDCCCCCCCCCCRLAVLQQTKGCCRCQWYWLLVVCVVVLKSRIFRVTRLVPRIRLYQHLHNNTHTHTER
jgi:hypothetical protein